MKLFPRVASRGLKWENKTYKLKRSIGSRLAYVHRGMGELWSLLSVGEARVLLSYRPLRLLRLPHTTFQAHPYLVGLTLNEPILK